MMEKSAFVRHMQVVTEAYAACDKIYDCLGVQEMDNGLIDLLNDSSLVYADMFKVDINNEDDFPILIFMTLFGKSLDAANVSALALLLGKIFMTILRSRMSNVSNICNFAWSRRTRWNCCLCFLGNCCNYE